jgi:hypothetical protein
MTLQKQIGAVLALLGATSLSACGGTSGFALGALDSIGGASRSPVGASTTSDTPTTTPPGTTPPTVTPEVIAAGPRALSSLLDPGLVVAGTGVNGVGQTTWALADSLPANTLVERVLEGTGTTVSQLGVAVRDGAWTGLPVVGGTAQSLVSGTDNLVGDLAAVSSLNQAFGGADSLIGLNAAGQNSVDGSLATINLLTGGDAAQLSLAQNPLAMAGSQIAPTVVTDLGNLVGGTPLAILPVSGATGGATNVAGGLDVGTLLSNTTGALGLNVGADGAGATQPALPSLPLVSNLPIVGGLLGL